MAGNSASKPLNNTPNKSRMVKNCVEEALCTLKIHQGRRKQFWSGPAKPYMKLQLKYCVKHNQQAKHVIARGYGGMPLKISYPE